MHNDTVALPPKKCKALIQRMKHYAATPKICELRDDLNLPKKKNKKKIKVLEPKTKKYPGVPDSYSKHIKDSSIYYSYFNKLYDTPDVDSIEIRIKEMEEWAINLLDGPSPPSP